MPHDHDRKKKVAIFAISAFFLVATVVAVVVGILTSKTDEEEKPGISHTKKAIEAFCQPTLYKKECVKSLAKANVKNKHNTKELAAEAFRLARDEFASALTKFSSIEADVNDTRGRRAIATCRQLAKIAIRDLERSEKSVDNYGKGDGDLFVEDLHVWIGGALADTDVCLDSFRNSTGKAGDKMKATMLKARELTSNSLAVIIELDAKWGKLHGHEKKGGDEEEEGGEEEEEEGGEEKEKGEKGGAEEEEKGDEEKGHVEEKEKGENGGGEEKEGTEDKEKGEKGGSEEKGGAKAKGTEEKGNAKEKGTEEKGKGFVPLAGELPEWVEDNKRNIMGMPVADIKADAVVAKDGSGNVTTVREALHMLPKKSRKAFVIYVKEGIYNEYLAINGRMTSVILIGDGPTKTIIASSKNFVDGWPTYMTATIDIDGDGFMARDITFENMASPIKRQAAAARVSSDYSIFYNCHFSGFHKTLNAVRSRQFYRDCTISGTVDIIFGDALAIFQNCDLLIRMPIPGQTSVVTAQARTDPNGPGATILQNCTITSEPGQDPTQSKVFLGRPVKPFSRVIVMQSFIDKIISPEGWTSLAGKEAEHKSVFYAEFGNKGPGSDQSGRVKWEGIRKLTEEKVVLFAPGKFFAGADQWITNTGCPYFGIMLPEAK